MKKIVLLFSLVLFFLSSRAQIAPDKYYIQFTDKNNSPYSLNHPEAFLTARSLSRRAAQNISISENDIPVNPQYIQGVAATGAQILNSTRWLNGVTIYTQDSTVLSTIEALPYVDHLVLLPAGIPGKKAFFESESVDNQIPVANKSLRNNDTYNYGYAYTQIHQINGTGLHDLGYRGQGMVIAILDAGYVGVQTHPLFDSLWENNQILGTKDFVHPGGNVFTEHSHGRMVLSCMGANIPGLMIGTAPKASYWLLRSEDGQSENVIEEYNWVSAAEFADSVGADVINSSLGYIDFDNPAFTHPYSEMNGNTCISTIGADIAATKGILVTNSAGNSGNNPVFPWIGAPADGDSVFTIGAVDKNGNRAVFSSQGPTYDGRIKPTVMAMGQGTTVADGNSGIDYGNGTSFSSPIMAGMTACLWQEHPNMTNMEIISAIKESASQHFSPDNYMGWGIPDFMQANQLLSTVLKQKSNTYFVTAYPNPFHTSFQLKFLNNKNKNFSIMLVNAMGNSIFDGLLKNIDTEVTEDIYSVLQHQPKGIYFLYVRSENQNQVLKLIKE